MADKAKQTETQTTPQIVSPFLPHDKAAEYLNISPKTLYLYNHLKKIPYFQPDRKCYYLISDLNDYIMKVGIKSNEQLEKTGEMYFDHCKKGQAI